MLAHMIKEGLSKGWHLTETGAGEGGQSCQAGGRVFRQREQHVQRPRGRNSVVSLRG